MYDMLVELWENSANCGSCGEERYGKFLSDVIWLFLLF